MSKDSEVIPAGEYSVKRLSAWVSRKGFDYVLTQKFEITAGPHKGRRLHVTQELDDSNILALQVDVNPG